MLIVYRYGNMLILPFLFKHSNYAIVLFSSFTKKFRKKSNFFFLANKKILELEKKKSLAKKKKIRKIKITKHERRR